MLIWTWIELQFCQVCQKAKFLSVIDRLSRGLQCCIETKSWCEFAFIFQAFAIIIVDLLCVVPKLENLALLFNRILPYHTGVFGANLFSNSRNCRIYIFWKFTYILPHCVKSHSSISILGF